MGGDKFGGRLAGDRLGRNRAAKGREPATFSGRGRKRRRSAVVGEDGDGSSGRGGRRPEAGRRLSGRESETEKKEKVNRGGRMTRGGFCWFVFVGRGKGMQESTERVAYIGPIR